MIFYGPNYTYDVNWQYAYEQLYTLYVKLSEDYQKSIELGQNLSLRLDALKKQNEQMKRLNATKLFTNSPIVQSSNQSIRLSNKGQKTIKQAEKDDEINKISPKIKKSNSIQTNQDNCYECPYQNCGRIYQSSVSMNLHIKIKHNGGTKKQRQVCAKAILNAQENGEEPPEVTLNFPPNFLEEFKITYNYMKKYSM